MAIAMLGSGIVGAQYIAGKAARDALFLSQFETSALPNMVIVTSIFSIVLVVASSRGLRRVSPSSWVPIAFAASAVLLIIEWALTSTFPGLAARTLYLQVSGLGPMLGSGFWLIASERFDPHTAKKRFGQIAGAGTLGGLAGGLIGERVAAFADVSAMLPMLAVLNIVCAWQIRKLAQSPMGARLPSSPRTQTPAPARSGFRVLSEARYLRSLAILVMLGAISAIFVDQAFKTQVKAAYGKGPALGVFFSRYYTAISLITFLVQTSGSRFVLERMGLAVATSTPAFTFLIGGVTSLIAPGFRSLLLVRGSEAVLRGSAFRAGYELFYTPIPPNDKRAVKSIIDVGFDRTGDIIGANIIKTLPAANQTVWLISLAVGCSAVAIAIAGRLKRGYSKTLEDSLLNRKVELDLAEVQDLVTRTTIMRTTSVSQAAITVDRISRDAASAKDAQPSEAVPADPELQDIVALRSRDRERTLRVLKNENGLSAFAVPHVIRLLAWDAVERECVRALRGVAEERVGELLDALLDPNESFAVRRRLARVFSVCVSQRATDGLMLGLEDLRFEVRFQCARSLLSIVEKNPRVRIDKDRLYLIVQNEVTVNRQAWENRRLLDAPDEGDERSFLEDLVRERANQSLAHVFTLLALVLPTEPLQIAFRGLHTDDENLRGTALEYLDGVLPSQIREPLWPFLEGRPPRTPSTRPRDEVLADLLRSRQSIMLNLKDLKARAATQS